MVSLGYGSSLWTPTTRLPFGGKACLSSAVLQCSHEPRATRSGYLLHFEAHPPRCSTGRIRGCLDHWREIATLRARFPALFSDRTVRPVFCAQRRRPLPRSHLPSALAVARSTPAVVSVDHARIAGAAFIRRQSSTASAGRTFEGKGLAQGQSAMIPSKRSKYAS